MADGRMLKKAISTSRRLADLKTDSARMLYTWIIPHLDIEGRYYADPDLIKGAVVPRLKHFTPEIITGCINDMAKTGLIILYEHDGDRYFQLRKFDEHQNLRKDREKPSEIPPPSDNSRITPGALPDNDGNTPIQDKLREVKIREVKRSDETPPLEENENQEPDALMQELREITEDIGTHIANQRDMRQVMLFIEVNIRKMNHRAMLHCLKSLQKQCHGGEKIGNPRAYLEAALKIEEGKHNAEDHAREAKERDGPMTQHGLTALGHVMAGITAGV